MRKYLIVFLTWFSLACISAIIALVLINPFADYQLERYGIPVQGWVIAKEPHNHQVIRYSYIVGGQTYNGVGHGGNGNSVLRTLMWDNK
jgi:hypothetical protein